MSPGPARAGRSIRTRIAQLAQQVEETVRGLGQAEVQSQDVGLAILGPLRELDEVAYLRFASVYRSFTSAEDFAAEIRNMRARAIRRRPSDRRHPTPCHPTARRHRPAPESAAIGADVPTDLRPPPVGVG